MIHGAYGTTAYGGRYSFDVIYLVSLNDELTIVDTITGRYVIGSLVVFDDITLTDLATNGSLYLVTVDDDVVLVDTETISISSFVDLFDTLTISEDIGKTVWLNISTNESVTLTEDIDSDSIRFSPQLPLKRPHQPYRKPSRNRYW